MNDSETRAAILASLQEVAPEASLEALSATTPFRDQLDIDSMDFLNIVIGIHERTGIDVPERDYPLLATLESAVAYLSQHAASQG